MVVGVEGGRLGRQRDDDLVFMGRLRLFGLVFLILLDLGIVCLIRFFVLVLVLAAGCEQGKDHQDGQQQRCQFLQVLHGFVFLSVSRVSDVRVFLSAAAQRGICSSGQEKQKRFCP